MGWLRRWWGLKEPERPSRPLDPLDFARGGRYGTDHLQGPYQFVERRVVVFDAGQVPDVTLDRVYEGSDGRRLHLLTPTLYWGRAQLREVSSLAHVLRGSDPDLGAMVLYWPAERGQEEAYFSVPLFRQVNAGPRLSARTVVEYPNVTVLDQQKWSVSPYAEPTYRTLSPADLSGVMGVSVEELTPLRHEVHMMCASTPGWFEVCDEVDEVKNEFHGNLRMLFREHGGE